MGSRIVSAVTTDSYAATKTSLEKLQSFIAEDLKSVDQVILDKLGSKAEIIEHMTSHLLNSGGKRLRPCLTLVSAKLCGYAGTEHIGLAAAVELIHTATLLHDDVVDESALRRGEETANNVWGNKASILVGDFLLGQSFRLMVESKSLEVLRILSDASAIIAEGEVLQMVAANNLDTSESSYIQIVASKTATLFAAACEIGAVVAGETAEKQEALRNFGRNLGIAFQIVDDALDYSATQEELGKTIGDDFREGKITLPVIHAYSKAENKELAFWERVIQDRKQVADDLERAVELIHTHKSLNYSMNQAVLYIARARKALEIFPNAGTEKEILLDLLEFCIKRPY